MELTDLPIEILEEVILNLDPIDVAHLSECCGLFRLVAYNPNDQALWRRLYLQQLPLDDPRECVSMEGDARVDVDWKDLVQRFIRLRTVLQDPTRCRLGERHAILKTLLEIITHVPPLSSALSYHDRAQNHIWAEETLSKGAFFEEIAPDISEEERQLYARLHTYFGLTQQDKRRSTRVQSRAFVYDMRNYRPELEYGPLDSRGHVNWAHVQAIHHIVSMHFDDMREDEGLQLELSPLSMPFTRIVIPPELNLEDGDWAGVNGQWRVSFCFVDHRELLNYNSYAYDATADTELDTSIFEQPGFGEVFRSLEVVLKVRKTTPDRDHPNRPIIQFIGEMVHSTSMMNGLVRMTPDNQIQWQFISGDMGDAVWSSVGIQIGGLRAPFGILGSWTTVAHDFDDPIGPFWLTKHAIAGRRAFNHVSMNPIEGDLV